MPHTHAARRNVTSLIVWLAADLRLWLAERGLWWATSVVVHALVLSTALLLMGRLVVDRAPSADRVVLSSIVEDVPEPEPLDHFEIPPLEMPTDPEIDLTVMAPSTSGELETGDPGSGMPGDPEAPPGPVTELPNHDITGGIRDYPAEHKGPGSGPKQNGVPGIFGNRAGQGGGGGRPGITGRTRLTDQAVAMAQRWIAFHQNADGSWSLQTFHSRCRDDSCRGEGSIKADAAATALGVLPFLAAGQIHRAPARKNLTPGHVDYHENVARGIYWLQSHQKTDGDLSAGSEQVMYSHALATIALAELFALSHDKNFGGNAQRAVNFIVTAQHPSTGGWRYKPGESGDTSVTAWQIMALKSAQIAGLEVPSKTIELAQLWLRSTADEQGALYSYEPKGAVSPSMTAAGLLSSQYLGAKRESLGMQQGVQFLMGQMPAAQSPNAYYCYYATQVLHNVPGPEWDTWNRHVRTLLTGSQSHTAGLCSLGSWSPSQPAKDAWGEQGGRLMVTCLNCLTLQVYYRYLPLYSLDGAGEPQR